MLQEALYFRPPASWPGSGIITNELILGHAIRFRGGGWIKVIALTTKYGEQERRLRLICHMAHSLHFDVVNKCSTIEKVGCRFRRRGELEGCWQNMIIARSGEDAKFEFELLCRGLEDLCVNVDPESGGLLTVGMLVDAVFDEKERMHRIERERAEAANSDWFW